MKLRLRGLTVGALDRIEIADVAEALLAKDPKAFRQAFGQVDRKSLEGQAQAFFALFGWNPPLALEEWRSIEVALPTADSDACWTADDQSLALDLPLELVEEKNRGEFLAAYAQGFFAGLFKIADDASGDRTLASLLPAPDAVPVFRMSHERGDLGEGQTLKSYLIDISLSDDDPDPDEAPGWVGERAYERIQTLLTKYDSRFTAQASRAAKLYERSRWTNRVLWSVTSPNLAHHLARAPTIVEWERERTAGFGSAPYLLNYWIVAHLLLGNDADAADAAQLAATSRGEATRWLGELATKILGGASDARLGKLDMGQLQDVRTVLRNAAPSLVLR